MRPGSHKVKRREWLPRRIGARFGFFAYPRTLFVSKPRACAMQALMAMLP